MRPLPYGVNGEEIRTLPHGVEGEERQIEIMLVVILEREKYAITKPNPSLHRRKNKTFDKN